MADREKACYGGPLGAVELTLSGAALAQVRLLRGAGPGRGRPAEPSPAMRRFLAALEGYFAGWRIGVPLRELDLSGCTAFQRRVYEALMDVPFGRVVTYGQMAARVGRPRGARAVGQALGRNPLPLFIPCHRVVAARGRLGGFGAGIDWKVKLLTHERSGLAGDRTKEAAG